MPFSEYSLGQGTVFLACTGLIPAVVAVVVFFVCGALQDAGDRSAGAFAMVSSAILAVICALGSAFLWVVWFIMCMNRSPLGS